MDYDCPHLYLRAMRSCLLAILLCENPIDYAWTGALPAIELVVPSMVPYLTRLWCVVELFTFIQMGADNSQLTLRLLS